MEVSDSTAQEPFLEGYMSARIRTPQQSYRAFFTPDRVEAAPHEAAFIFCTNDSTPISLYCSVVGVVPGGCFYTGYGAYKLTEIDTLIQQVHAAAPQWRQATPNNSFKGTPLRGAP